ncbi:MAG: SDR family NAD(P)-dependent oxidoreductase [Alphaproteobacteria bacterium]|nr:SDR family NAD(P)-dependent oxidoreductase [Alphaproteobacteria bacterium]
MKLRPQKLADEWWLILGASSKVGMGFAEAVARRQGSVILAGRSLRKLTEQAAELTKNYPMAAVEVQIFDASLGSSRWNLRKYCEQRIPPGKLNIFLGFAHYADQPTIEPNLELAATVLDTSLNHAALTLLEFIPLLETQPGGRVIVVGSVSGERGRSRNYIYGAAKAGLAVVAAGLRARLHPSGVSVLIVKSGLLRKSDQPMRGWRGLLAAPPAAAAEAWLRASLAGRNSIYYPWFWRWMSLALRLVPEAWFKRMRF